MREYRGKSKDTGEWVYGYFCMFGDSAQIFVPYTEEEKEKYKGHFLEKCYGRWEIVIPETVGQETGVPDRNGKQIFDGDICRDTKTGEIVSAQWHGTMAGFVWSKRKDNSYLFDFGALFRACDKYEVIGNIHDNPELLERKDGAE